MLKPDAEKDLRAEDMAGKEMQWLAVKLELESSLFALQLKHKREGHPLPEPWSL